MSIHLREVNQHASSGLITSPPAGKNLLRRVHSIGGQDGAGFHIAMEAVRQKLLDALKFVAIFSALSEDQLVVLRNSMVQSSFQKGEYVFEQALIPYSCRLPWPILKDETPPVTTCDTTPRHATIRHVTIRHDTPHHDMRCAAARCAAARRHPNPLPAPPSPLPAPPNFALQDDDGDSFYVIMDGTAKVLRAEEDDSEGVLTELQPGAYFGERALLKNDKRFASVKASSALETMCITRQQFETVLGPLQDLVPDHY